jgi:hypothetical protein
MNPFHFDWTINIAELAVLGANVIVLVKIFLVMRDYPPHRHTNGDIIYPKGMFPEQISKMNEKKV